MPARAPRSRRARRKLASRAWPCSVAMLSGWNWTPWIGSVAWRSPMTTPSSVRALTISAGGHALLRHRQRMVARGGEGRGEIGEDAAAIVQDRAGLAVHQARRADDLAAEILPDRLMAEADAEQGPAGIGGGGDEIERDAGLVRRAGAGRDQERLARPTTTPGRRRSHRCAPPRPRRPASGDNGRGSR